MTDHSRNALLGMCSALREIVTPGVRADNPLAQQELSMVIRYLEFLVSRVELLHDRAVVEMRAAESLGRGFVGCGEVGSGAELTAALEGAVLLLRTPFATIDQLRATTDDVHEAVSSVLREAYRNGDPGVRKLEALVLDWASESSLFERAWYAPLGDGPLHAGPAIAQ